MVVIEQHFVEHNGSIYTDIAFSYLYWKEYLEVFDEVCPIARVSRVEKLPEGWIRADGEGVAFVKIQDYLGFWDFLKKSLRVFRDCFSAAGRDGCYLLRLGNISTFCWLRLLVNSTPYAFEVVGHAGESVLQVKNVQYFGLAKLIAKVNHAIVKQQVKKACCVSYVSEYVRKLYPPKAMHRSWIFSGVKLSDEVVTGHRNSNSFNKDALNIVSVGRLEPEKGHSILIESLKTLAERGFVFQAKIIGPGKEYDRLASTVRELNLQNNVKIIGKIPWGTELFKELDWADLFVIPSLTEGMPRALIEAMARGLPAIGTNTGGIPELINKDYLVAPGDPASLSDKIEALARPELLEKISRNNFEIALRYSPERMRIQKREFWNCLKSSNLPVKI